jgi:hypothetical protein
MLFSCLELTNFWLSYFLFSLLLIGGVYLSVKIILIIVFFILITLWFLNNEFYSAVYFIVWLISSISFILFFLFILF